MKIANYGKVLGTAIYTMRGRNLTTLFPTKSAHETHKFITVKTPPSFIRTSVDMLTILTNRPASSSLETSPSKRNKTPSPQKPMLRGYYTPSRSSFQAKLEKMRLTSPAARIPKPVHSATIPLSMSSSDKKNLSEAGTSTAAPQTTQTKEGFHQSFKQEIGNPMTLPDLWIASLNTVERKVDPQETIKSIPSTWDLL